MTPFLRAPALCCLMMAAGCASAPVTESMALHGETLRALDRNALNSSDLSLFTAQTLRVLDLAELWDERPAEVPDRILSAPEGLEEWLAHAARAEIYVMLAKRASTDAGAQTYFLEAVLTAVQTLRAASIQISPFDPRQRLVAEIYNRGLARFLALGQELNGHPSTWRNVQRLDGAARFEIARGEDLLDPADFDEFIPAEERTYSGRLINRHREFGVGATLIATRRPGRGRVFGAYTLPTLHSLPATAVLTTGETDDTVELRFVDPFRADVVQAARSEPLPLAIDLSAPLGHAVAEVADPTENENLGFFDPEQTEARRGIYMLQPYDPNRIPLLFVHGLWSSPLTWIEMINEVWGDPALRKRYQVWLYLYPSGLAIALNGAMFRSQLDEIRSDLDPEDDDPAMQNMVVIGHSMGGILTKTLVSRSGEEVWNRVASEPFDQVVASDEDREMMRSLGFFEPKPYVKRVVFIATPHRGADLADNIVGTVGNWLITLPPDVEELHARVVTDNPGLFPDYDDVHTSIDDLSKSSGLLQSLTALPIREGLPYHTIMGDTTGVGAPDGHDGVVENRSSHLDGAASEIVVPHDHSAQRHPRAQLEVRRILREHLRLSDSR